MNTNLFRPYATAGSSLYAGVLGPTDVHHWAEDDHTEDEWQARGRVLADQEADADVDLQRLGVLVGAALFTLVVSGVMGVFSVSQLSYDPLGHIASPAPLILTVVSFLLLVGSGVCVWCGLMDTRDLRIKARKAERATREHNIAYLRAPSYPQSIPPADENAPGGAAN